MEVFSCPANITFRTLWWKLSDLCSWHKVVAETISKSSKSKLVGGDPTGGSCCLESSALTKSEFCVKCKKWNYSEEWCLLESTPVITSKALSVSWKILTHWRTFSCRYSSRGGPDPYLGSNLELLWGLSHRINLVFCILLLTENCRTEQIYLGK